MPQHLLDCADVSPMRKKMGRETMSQNVRRYGLGIDTGRGGALLENLENTHSGKFAAEPCQKKMAF